MHVHLVLVLAASVSFAAAVLPTFPPFHPSRWTAVVDSHWDPATIATNDYAAYVVANYTVTSLDGFTGAVRWVNNISGAFTRIQTTANKKWLIVQTGFNFFVFDAVLGAFASQSQNFSYVTGSPNVYATQFDDVFMGVGESSAYIAQVMSSGELQTVWTSNLTNAISSSLRVAPGSPFMYHLAECNTLDAPALQVVNIQSRDVVCTMPAQSTSHAGPISSTNLHPMTPTNRRLTILDGWGTAKVIDLTMGCSVVWENALDNTFSGFHTTTVIQTEGTIIVTGSQDSYCPLFVLCAETGEQIENYTTYPGNQLLASTIAAGRLVALVLNVSYSDAVPVLVAMDLSTGSILSFCIVPSLPAPNYAITSIGNGAVMVPNGQGFVTFSALDVSTPLSYNLYSPGATNAVAFTSPQLSMFILMEETINGKSISGFASSL
ncbi:membrane-associated protein, putative [Bodo saltans]|uniref:Membrane-associated protein, putative n=1 Tax=Bodo saltans TaxID=75058 RepID=A0A0S4J1Y2_BODSA|nr:membrane-associated protein, putative [Bodo saltans]|eukprot:CUG51905.1 membrane-associated protein, putative [Bodo saltans]